MFDLVHKAVVKLQVCVGGVRVGLALGLLGAVLVARFGDLQLLLVVRRVR